MTKEIVTHKTIDQIINNYTRAQELCVAGFTMLSDCEKCIKDIGVEYFHTVRQVYNIESECKEVMQKMLSDTWRYILKKTRATEFMTQKRYEAFQKSLENPKELPEITHDSIQNFIKNILDAAPDMLNEFITETFDFLHPGHWSIERYKTNQKSRYELKEKVIKTYVFRKLFYGPGVEWRHSGSNSMNAMNNAFHLIDGREIPKYPNDLETQLRDACNKKEMGLETEYFKMKFFLNGNLHITFKRMDIVQKINKIAGENLIKPQE